MIRHDSDKRVGYEHTTHSITFPVTLERHGQDIIIRGPGDSFRVRIASRWQEREGHPLLYEALKQRTNKRTRRAIVLGAQQQQTEILVSYSTKKKDRPIPVEPDPSQKEGHRPLFDALTRLLKGAHAWTEFGGTFRDMSDISPSDPHQRRAISGQASSGRGSRYPRIQVVRGGLPGSRR